MAWLGTFCEALLLVIGMQVAACSSSMKSEGTAGAAPAGAGSGGAPAQGALGSICMSANESVPNFSGYGVRDLNIETDSPACSSKLCLKNHFQGRVSCPYGQTAAGGGCFVPGGSTPVAVPVEPQFQSRQASVASICSCHCAGSGPGPYCTCPSNMECVPLLQDLGFGGESSTLAGSYCIPASSRYDPTGLAIPCTPPNCGPARPY
jgi:hypothetical protein